MKPIKSVLEEITDGLEITTLNKQVSLNQDFLINQLSGIRQSLAERKIRVDFLIHPEDEFKDIRDWLCTEKANINPSSNNNLEIIRLKSGLEIELRNLKDLKGGPDHLASSILVFAIDPNGSEDLISRTLSSDTFNSYTTVLPDKRSIKVLLERRLFQKSLTHLNLDIVRRKNDSLINYLETLGDERLLKQKNYSISLRILDLLEVIKLAVVEDVKRIKGNVLYSRKNDLSSSSQSILSTDVRDFLNTLSASFNSTVSEYLYGLKERYDLSNKVTANNLVAELKAMIVSLKDLETTRKRKKSVNSIDENFYTELLDKINSVLRDHMIADIKTSTDLLHQLEAENQQGLSDSGFSIQKHHYAHLTLEDVSRTLSNTVFIDKKFESESSKKGFYQYFMSIRRYQMIFFMIFSSFGAAAIMNKYFEIFIPLGILLLLLGIILIYNNVQRESKENYESNVNKAQEFLNAQLMKIISNATRNWTGTVDKHLKTEQQRYLKEIQKKMSELQERINESKRLEEKKFSKRQSKLNETISNVEYIQKMTKEYRRSAEDVLIEISSSISNGVQ